MRSAYLFFVLLLLKLPAFAQNADSSDYYYTGFQAHYGFIIPHAEAIEPVSHTNPYGFEVSLNRLSTSFERWSIFNHYSISGLQASYFNFQSPGILGSAYIVTVFSEAIFGYSLNFMFSLKAGLGVAYHNRVYDPDENQLNKFFSTRLGFPLYVKARFKYKLNQQTYFTLSGSYNHISNGGVKVPNYGMNFPSASLGIEYFQKPIPYLGKVYVPDRKMKEPMQNITIQLLLGYKEVYGNPFYAVGLHTRYSRQILIHYGLNAGAEIILDGGIRESIKIQELDLDYKRAAITLGQDLIFGKVTFTQYFGVYFYSPYKAKKSIYEAYILSYKIIPEFMIGIYLKAHTINAELLGLTMSYQLNKK